MRIFATGATGFIGRAFCLEAQRRGHQILALVRNPGSQLPPGVEIAVGSLVDTPWKQVEKFAPDAVLHLAWIATPGEYLHSAANYIWLEQSKTWFQNLIEIGIPCIAGAGTCIEYASSPDPLREDSSLIRPQYPYSFAKHSLCEWLTIQAERLNFNNTWFRVFHPYGPGEHEKRVCTSLIAQLKAGKPLLLRTPNSIKDYVFIDDVASGICQALESKLKGQVNIGSGSGVSIRTLALLTANVIQANPILVQTSDEVTIDANPIMIADMHRLQSLGWHSKTNLATGLRILVESLTTNPC